MARSAHVFLSVPGASQGLVTKPQCPRRFSQLLHCRVPTIPSSLSRSASLGCQPTFHPLPIPLRLSTIPHSSRPSLSFSKARRSGSVNTFISASHPFTLRYRISFTIFSLYKYQQSIASRSAFATIYFSPSIAIRDICYHIRQSFEIIN